MSPAAETSSTDSVHCPALLIAASASGQGKTTVTSALARMLHGRGLRVQVFKYGPDFLDPTWLSAASGQPADNLDLAMCGEADARRRLARAAERNDVILVEAAMGLFDGARSAADLAALWNMPVLLVLDASGMAETFGAVAYGLTHYRAGLRFAGVLANRVASARHAELLQRGMPDDVAWLGHVPRQNPSDGVLPSRHLGVLPAEELADAGGRIALIAQALADTALGQKAWHAWQSEWSVAFSRPEPAPASQRLAGRTIAIARDAAFSFIYPANVEFLQEQGAALRFFSPLAGDALPDCDALWLPGGYPELHAQALGARSDLAAQIRAHWRADRPIWAECGGMLALMQHLHWPQKEVSAPLLGVLAGEVTMHPRLKGLGLQGWQSPWGLLRGHGFHYSSCATELPVVGKTYRLLAEDRMDTSAALEVVHAQGSLRASYFHAWFASNPEASAQLFL